MANVCFLPFIFWIDFVFNMNITSPKDVYFNYMRWGDWQRNLTLRILLTSRNGPTFNQLLVCHPVRTFRGRCQSLGNDMFSPRDNVVFILYYIAFTRLGVFGYHGNVSGYHANACDGINGPPKMCHCHATDATCTCAEFFKSRHTRVRADNLIIMCRHGVLGVCNQVPL